MTSIQEQLHGYSEREIERILELGKNRLQVLNEGRKKGQLENSKRGGEHREKWKAKAKDLKSHAPYLMLDKLASAVLDWSQASGIRFRNGQNLAAIFGTILENWF